MTELFGKGRTCGKHGLEELFRDDTIYLKKGNGEYWSIIQFDGGNTDLLRKMHSVVESIPSLSRGGNCPTKSISLVELSFDVPFPGLAYEQVEMILRYFANHLVPKNPRARFRFKSSDKFMKAKDGATNGKLTVYYHSLDINEEGPPKSWVSKTKGYPKKVGGVWHIRLEVTLRRQAVKKYLGRSCDLLVLADTVAQQDWRDYFHFELIDYDGFCDRALELARKLPMGRQIVFYKLRREGKDQPAVEQNYHMREISRYLKSMKLGGLERKTADFRRRIPL